MEKPLAYQAQLDLLIAYASMEARKPDLLAAKADYFRLTGEVFEDDKNFEMRMASFLDHYLYDRKSPETSLTPAEEFYQEQVRGKGQDAAAPFRGFTETTHGLFEFRKLKAQQVRLRDLFSGKDYDITERRTIAGLEKGDILEARLIPFDGHLWFSSAFCYHPREAGKAILKEIKRRKKKEPDRPTRDMVWECAKRSLKMDRYRQIPVDKIYDFENSPI
jgi:hypothetical protein